MPTSSFYVRSPSLVFAGDKVTIQVYEETVSAAAACLVYKRFVECSR